MTQIPPLPQANYLEVSIINQTGDMNAELYVTLVSNTQAYLFTQYQNSDQKTVYVATPYIPTGNWVDSIQLSTLVNEIDTTIGFYVEVFANNTPIAFTSGRIYFSDTNETVPYTNGLPGGVSPNAQFDFDFVEFTVAITNTNPVTSQLNLDTSQVDQFGIPIYLQVSPITPDYKDGTGILPTLNRSGIIEQFKTCTSSDSGSFSAYKDVVIQNPNRLLAPQHVIDANSNSLLQKAFDTALYNLFNYYYNGNGGDGHSLYLVGNGKNGTEIFTGNVIDNFPCNDINGNPGTYTVFEFVGSGYYYNNSDASLTQVGEGGGATYQIFYPYFGDNEANSFNNSLSATSDAPYWFGGFNKQNAQYNLPLTSAGRMVFGASGVFADNISQQTYYNLQNKLPTNFDSEMLGNLENQLVTMLNRGISTIANNMQLRTGSNSANDLISADLTNIQNATIPNPSGTIFGAALSYSPDQLLKKDATVPSENSVLYNNVSGTIYFTDSNGTVTTQSFEANPTDITQPFTLTPSTTLASNYVTQASYVIENGVPPQIQFNWLSAPMSSTNMQVEFELEYAPTTSEAHYAILRFFSPYNQPQLEYQQGDLGPANGFSANLTAATDNNPESGMTMTGIGLSEPTYIYNILGDSAIIVYSPQAVVPINTNILTFSTFYPTDSNYSPLLEWNAYAAFFHTGLNGGNAPTVDGKGYAFAFDDNGGYSSDITVNLPSTEENGVVVTVSLTLLPWQT